MTEILTALLLFVTAWYAWTTRRILLANEAAVEAMREQSEALTRPHVIVETFNEGATYYLRVRNGGTTVAHDLRLQMDRSFHQWGRDGRDISASQLFTVGTASFSPGSEIVYGLGVGHDLFRDDSLRDAMPVQFSVTATYRFGSRTVEEKTTIDLEQYRGMMLHWSPLEKELKGIREALEKQNSELRQLQDLARDQSCKSPGLITQNSEAGGRVRASWSSTLSAVRSAISAVTARR
ncbi:hypothetical protein [Rubricoccus marinus]|uniref:Uncharacterized protein n=1 Tax=Rubricoccus marinus TaxID=716817 RepID=A0A259U2E5_9BACT|nr:hypothetical protein [Rubricoccus marinus]OZC04017.1 hypothetical protein BSZ36_14115 [Rubricoccus marinus]